MKSEYSFEHFQKRREEIRKKSSDSKQTLIKLFWTTFSIVLCAFFVLASLMSPNLNIPALNDDESESVDSISSSDFKSRVDYRLKQIQMDDGVASSTSTKTPMIMEDKKTENKENSQDNLLKIDLSSNENLATQNKNYPYPTPDFKNQTQSKTMTQPSKPKTETTAKAPTPYVPQNNTAEAKNYKILVGNYTSPEEAQNISDAFSAASSTRSHIKSYNGFYCVQVGSYSDYTKAQTVANNYRSKNYKVRVLEE